MTVLMADSVTPSNIPEAYRADRTRGVAPYGTGPYTWPTRTDKQWPRRQLGIDVDNTDPQGCNILDVERYDATPADWPVWRQRRVDYMRQHNQDHGWPIVYSSIEGETGYGVAAVKAAVEAAGQEPVQHWWIAWYWTPGPGDSPWPTAAQVVAEVKMLTGVELGLDTIWGCQYATGLYDASVIYQDPGWL